MKTQLFLILFLFVFVSTAYAEKPNIIILSLDSFRREPSFQKNFDPKIMPNLDRFTDNGFLFKNVFTANAWANLGHWIAKIPKDVFLKSGYEFPGTGWNIPTMRKFGIEENKDFPQRFFILLPADENKYELGLSYLKKKLEMKRSRPVLLQIHIKYLHPPLAKSGLDEKSFNDRLNDYKNRPEKHAEKAVLLSLLFDDELRTKHSPQVLRAIAALIKQQKLSRDFLKLKYINLTEIPNLMELWERSPDYEKDLLLLKKLYSANQTALDGKLQDFFDFFKNDKNFNNSVFIICGNFGFGMMEHGQLFNSLANYDEFIGTHLFIKTPDSRGLKIINQQASLKSVSTFIYSLLEEGFKTDNVNLINESEILSKSYNNDKFSLRQNNEWKLHIDLVNSKRELFNLIQDPREEKNLIQVFPEKTAELETKILNELISE